MKNKKTDMKNRFADTGKSYAGYFLRFVFCLVLTAAASLAQAQNRNQVSGKVTDKAGEPLIDRKSTRLNSSHWNKSRMPSSA